MFEGVLWLDWKFEIWTFPDQFPCKYAPTPSYVLHKEYYNVSLSKYYNIFDTLCSNIQVKLKSGRVRCVTKLYPQTSLPLISTLIDAWPKVWYSVILVAFHFQYFYVTLISSLVKSNV